MQAGERASFVLRNMNKGIQDYVCNTQKVYFKRFFYVFWKQGVIEPNINVFVQQQKIRQWRVLSCETASLLKNNHAFWWSTRSWHRKCHDSHWGLFAFIQILVSWCQRLEGRMLSTFSMTKFKGANRVLRNCKASRHTRESDPSSNPFLLTINKSI